MSKRKFDTRLQRVRLSRAAKAEILERLKSTSAEDGLFVVNTRGKSIFAIVRPDQYNLYWAIAKLAADPKNLSKKAQAKPKRTISAEKFFQMVSARKSKAPRNG